MYSVVLPTAASLAKLRTQTTIDPPIELTDTAGHGYHSVAFSPFGGYYVLSYRASWWLRLPRACSVADGSCAAPCSSADGPSYPWQKLVSVDDKEAVVVLTDNAKLQAIDATFEKGEKIWTTVKSGENGEQPRPSLLQPPGAG